MSSVGADCHCGNGIVMGTHVEKQLAGLNVDETHYTILAQYTYCLHRREKKPRTHDTYKQTTGSPTDTQTESLTGE